jgi:hypothetical protein
MKKARRLVFGITVAAWLWLCWAFWRGLIIQAATSGDLYARTPSFQLINFVLQYLWAFLLLLAVALFLEWAALRIIDWYFNGRRRQVGDGA